MQLFSYFRSYFIASRARLAFQAGLPGEMILQNKASTANLGRPSKLGHFPQATHFTDKSRVLLPHRD